MNSPQRKTIFSKFILTPQKLLQYLSDGFLASLLWKANDVHPIWTYIKRIIYILIPVVLIGSFGIMIYDITKIGVNDDKFYSFTEDNTTVFTIFFLFFFMYFLNGIFLYHFNRAIKATGGHLSTTLHGKYKRRIVLTQFIISFLCFAASFIAIFFLYTARNSGKDQYWFSLLTPGTYCFFCVLVIMTLYFVLRVCFSILLNSIHVIIISSKNPNIHMHSLYYYFPLSLGVGIGFIISSGMLFLSDYIAFKYSDLEFAFHEFRYLGLFALVIFFTFYFGTLLLCWIPSLSSPNNSKPSNIADKGHYKEKLISFCTFILTALIPGIAALVQLLDPLSEFIKKIIS